MRPYYLVLILCLLVTGTARAQTSAAARDASVEQKQAKRIDSVLSSPPSGQGAAGIGDASSVNPHGPYFAGGFTKKVFPGQKTQIAVRDFDLRKHGVWVDHKRVSESSISLAGEARDLSFTVPDISFPAESGDSRSVSVSLGPMEDGDPGDPAKTARLPKQDREARDAHDAHLTIKQRGVWNSSFGGIVITLLILAPFALLLWGMSIWQPQASSESSSGRTRSLWLVDKQTNSYSLQRTQFLVWTAAAVIAYIYAFWSLRVVQGVEHFPELPGNLIKVLGISAGTSLLASGVRYVKGPEGAGAGTPSARDLITTGDLVALDKVQLLVWTVIGLAPFLYTVLVHDPLDLNAKMEELPEAIWQLAGLSGAIFVAGKVVREPGPVLSEVVYQRPASGNALIFELRGTNLSQDAAFYAGNVRISIDRIVGAPINPPPASGPLNLPTPTVTVPGDSPAARMVRGLHLEVRSGQKDDPIPETAIFAIENPDGQRAEIKYVLKAA